MQNNTQPDQKRLKYVAIFVFVSFLIMGGVLIWNNIRYSNMGKLTTTVAPDDITLKIGTKQVKANRMIYVTPGTYKWEAKRQDFTIKTGTLSIKKGESKALDVYLQPSNDAGAAWLASHPEQGQKIEAQVGKRYDQLSKQATEETPLINKLPFVAPGEEFRVDYGSGTVNGKPKTTIYIAITSELAKQHALEWIKAQGTDPSTLNIVYNTVAPPPTSNEDRW